MKDEYDLKKLKHRRNPYVERLTQPVTLQLSKDVIEFFQDKSRETGIPCQTLINFYLHDCMTSNRNLEL